MNEIRVHRSWRVSIGAHDSLSVCSPLPHFCPGFGCSLCLLFTPYSCAVSPFLFRCFRCVSVSFLQSRFLPPRTGLSVSTNLDGMGDPEAALSRLAKKGMDSGMMRDWTFRSPLAPGTNKYEKPTQFRQRQARKGLWNFRQNALLAIVRTVLFKKVRS
jgi:hypothetical protein